MVQWVRLQFVSTVSHTGTLAQVLAVPLMIQLLANAPGKAAGESPNAWAPATHIR